MAEPVLALALETAATTRALSVGPTATVAIKLTEMTDVMDNMGSPPC